MPKSNVPMRQNSTVDIIIRGSGKLPLTRRLLRSIHSSESKLPIQIIYIDGGSDKVDLAQLLTDIPGIVYVALPYNPGAVRSINLGLSQSLISNAKYILLLDNDCEIPKNAGTDWLERMCKYLDDNEHVGAVGAVNYGTLDGKQVEVEQTQTDTQLLDDFALMLRKSAIEKIGMFDERFEPGLLEDVDYLIRLHERGYQARLAADVQIMHKSGETINRFDIQALMQANINKLLEKHGIDKLRQYGLEIIENKPVEPDRRKISLLVPTLNRSAKLQTMLASVKPLVEADGNIEVVVAPMASGGKVPDYPWVKVFPRPESARAAVPGFNWCYKHSTGDIIVVGGDDVSYIDPDFFTVIREEIAQLPEGEGMAESRTGQCGELEAMQALTREFIEKELGGNFMYPGYKSWYGNSEQTARAMKAGKHRLTNRAKVSSSNPVLDGTPPDATYKEGERWHEEDRKLFVTRMAQGFPNDFIQVESINQCQPM